MNQCFNIHFHSLIAIWLRTDISSLLQIGIDTIKEFANVCTKILTLVILENNGSQ